LLTLYVLYVWPLFTLYAWQDHRHLEASVTYIVSSLIMGVHLYPAAALTMETLWSPSVPDMKLRVFQFDRLFRERCPTLHRHTNNLGMGISDVVVAQSFLTLHAYSVPLGELPTLTDYLFTVGLRSLFALGLRRLIANQAKLLAMNLEEIGKEIRRWRSHEGASLEADASNAAEFIKSCSSLEIVTAEKLVFLEEELSIQMCSEQIAATGEHARRDSFDEDHPLGGANRWLNRYGKETVITDENALRTRSEMDALDEEARRDAAVLAEKIDAASQRANALEESLAALQIVLGQEEVVVEDLVKKKLHYTASASELLKQRKPSRFNILLGNDISNMQRRAGAVEKEITAGRFEVCSVQRKIDEAALELEEARLMKSSMSDMLMIMLECARDRQVTALKNSLRRESSR